MIPKTKEVVEGFYRTASMCMTSVGFILLAGTGIVNASNGNTTNSPIPVSGHTISPKGITPADVLARLHVVRDQTELIRFEMGKPKAFRTKPLATNAQAHEIYFQALTLVLKADRLALEFTGSTSLQLPPVMLSTIAPYHIWQLINTAYGRLLTVKEELGLTQTFPEHLQDPSTTLTQVGRMIVETNRQLNLLLERRFSPSDVFQQVQLASEYAQRLLTRIPRSTFVPKTPALERGKQPNDVFLLLIQCYGTLETIAQHSHLSFLHVDQEAARQAVTSRAIAPSDVYDMATLLVSDLAYLHAYLQDPNPPKPTPYPGRLFPSHVYQQASVLLNQLEELESYVKFHPDWMKP